MKKLPLVVIICAGLFSATAGAADADSRISFGAGLGALYNGLGVNLALLKRADLKYVAMGCSAFGYSSRNGASSRCGVGIGWMRSDILSENDRHGLGLHVGLTGNGHASASHAHNGDGHNGNGMEVFIGIPYSYFFKGMTAGGAHLGLTPTLGRVNDKTSAGLLLNLGYQF